jgi:hypothetical protein
MFYIPEVAMQILVFRTNIASTAQKEFLISFLRGQIKVDEINIDMEDVDKVLRVVSDSATCEQIISLLRAQGFFCEELF